MINGGGAVIAINKLTIEEKSAFNLVYIHRKVVSICAPVYFLRNTHHVVACCLFRSSAAQQLKVQ